MSMLDESRPFGRVVGSLEGIRYEQDGKFFNGQKMQIDAEGKPVDPDATPAPKADAPKPEPAKKPAAKKSRPEGVKPLRDQVKESEA